ncbi:MAG: ADP-ribosylation factor-like protein [Promethearchaeota archaeon]
MKINKNDGITEIKLLYWGMAGSGKTTIIDTLYKITKSQKKEMGQLISIEPKGELKKIGAKSGATLYFDRGFFQSKFHKTVNYHVFTVAGQNSFSPLRLRIFEGTDGVIFVVDSQTHFFEDNIESLKELKNVARGKLITEIPLIVMLNKQDLENVIHVEDFIQVLKNEKLWNEPNDELYMWNPIIYETCALFDKKKNIYQSFSELARRTQIYKTYGKGKAPLKEIMSDVPI